MMKKAAANLVLAAVFLTGLGLLLYPHIGFWDASRQQAMVIQGYEEALEGLDEETVQLELEKAESYNAKLKGSALKDPFIAGSGKVLADDYASVLHITEEMGVVKIPRISVNLPFYHGTAEETLIKGVGHLEGSALPIGGESSHCVLTGHTGLNTAKMFTDLTELEVGDEFFLLVLGKNYAYQIDQIKVVTPENLQDLKPVMGRDLATLITCTPYSVNSHRLLVRGSRVPYTEEEAKLRIEETGRIMGQETLLLATSICALFVLTMILLAVKSRRRKRG